MLELSRYLYLAGALPFFVLGLAHALATPRAPADVKGLSPSDPQLAEAMTRSGLRLTRRTDMWRAWVGFNFSHSLGACRLRGLRVRDRPQRVRVRPGGAHRHPLRVPRRRRLSRARPALLVPDSASRLPALPPCSSSLVRDHTHDGIVTVRATPSVTAIEGGGTRLVDDPFGTGSSYRRGERMSGTPGTATDS